MPLYSNAFYLMAANVTTSVFGFVFWVVAARFYPPEVVGLASALISAAGLLAGLSYLGLGMALIRFLPQAGDGAARMVNTALTVGALAALVASGVFLAGLGWWSPSLEFVRHSPLFLIAFVLTAVVTVLWTLVSETFVASRAAGFVLAGALVFSVLKVALVVAMVAYFSTFGIFGAWGMALGVTVLLGIAWFLPRAQPGYRPSVIVDRGVLKEVFRYSFGNYVSFLFWGIPGWVLPILVLNRLGADANGFYYIGVSVGSILNIVASATAASLFAEGSHDEARLDAGIRRSLKLVGVILVPAVVVFLVVGGQILVAFGRDYSDEATNLLRILAVASLPMAVNVMYLNVKRVQKRLPEVILLSAFVAVMVVGLAFALLPHLGIKGAGVAVLAGHAVPAVIIAGNWARRKWLAKGHASST